MSQFGIPEGGLLVQPNGVEVSQFDIKENREEARKKLGLLTDVPIAVYTGHLFSWKGTDTLIDAVRLLERQGWSGKVFFVGGTDDDVWRSKHLARDIGLASFVGHKPHEEIPLWLRAANVLILPNTAREDISKYFTSPMKLFEYMASGTPVIASDLPSIRHIASESTVTFFEPDQALSLAERILDVINYPERVQMKAEAARREVAKYTWKGRANAIIEFHESTNRT